MAKVTEHRFTVSGRGQFPIDMLRYDGCTPRTETDSGFITTSFFLRGRMANPQSIALVGPREPTNGRWESFGWRVVEHETVTH
jgi:hypothetical protein